MPIRSRYGRSRSNDASEAGWSMIELIIVIAIVSILSAIVMISFRSSKSAAYAKEAAATGATYAQVVARYQADHSRQNPTNPAKGGVAPGNNGPEQQRGPTNLAQQPYLSPIPDAITSGRMGVSWVTSMSGICGSGGKPAPPGATSQVGWITVCLGADPAYAVRVSSRSNSSMPWGDAQAKSCFVGGSGIARTPAC